MHCQALCQPLRRTFLQPTCVSKQLSQVVLCDKTSHFRVPFCFKDRSTAVNHPAMPHLSGEVLINTDLN